MRMTLPPLNQRLKNARRTQSFASPLEQIIIYGHQSKRSCPMFETHLDGNLSLPHSIKQVQDIVQSGVKTWLAFTGSKVDWIGSRDLKTGWINSHGQQWHDANPPGKTGLPNRPHLLRWSVSDGSIMRFKSMKPIGWNADISGSNTIIEDIIIDAVSTWS
jgi:hypothetical protein